MEDKKFPPEHRSRTYEIKNGLTQTKPSPNCNEKAISSLNQFPLMQQKEKKLSKLKDIKHHSLDSIKYNIYWINSQENDRVYEIKLELPTQCTVEDCIVQSIKYLNHQFKYLKTPYSLPEHTSIYNIYHAKKNGHPKIDYPCFEHCQILSQTQILNFSLVGGLAIIEKNEENILSTCTPHDAKDFLFSNKDYRSDSPRYIRNPEIYENEDDFSYNCLCFKFLKRKKAKI